MIKHLFTSGFTIVELMVAVAIMAILGVSVVGFASEQLRIYSVANTRTILAAEVQQQLQGISDDIRSSNGVAQYNGIPDNNAPQTLQFTGTTGPADQKYYWRSASGQLVLERVPVTAANEPIYDNATTRTGKKDYIIYYVRDGSLYRRIVPADYPTNKEVITNCASNYSAGGCDSDRRLTSNLRGGVNGFQVTYLAKNGSTVPTADPTTVQTVSVKLDTETKRSGQTIQVDDTAQIGFRTAKNGAEAIEFPASVIAGPGGLFLSQGSSIRGTNVAVQGRIDVENDGKIGTSANPLLVTAANKGCGTGIDYGKVVCSSQPISLYWYSNIYGDVCARGQTQSTWNYNSSIQPGAVGTPYTQGLINTNPPCTPPDVEIPPFQKSAYTGYATQKQGSDASCDGNNNVKPTTTWTGDTVYIGNVTLSQGCIATMQGNVYITGNLEINYNAKLHINNTGKQPIIVVNGSINLFWGAVVETEGGDPPYFISFKSRDAACSSSPSCTVISDGTMRKDSVNDETISMSYGSVVSGSLFNAYFGTLRIFQTDNIQAGALAGQRISTAFNGDIILLQ